LPINWLWHPSRTKKKENPSSTGKQPFETPKMKLITWILAIWVAVALGQGQQFPVCTTDLVKSDDCADVINPAACYNQFRWSARTMSCIEGKDNADKQRKVSQSTPPGSTDRPALGCWEKLTRD
jgi:hypothetical protein